MKKGTIKGTSYDTLESTIMVNICPYIGDYQIQATTPLDYKRFLDQMAEEGASYSKIRKIYYALSAAFNRAIKVKMLKENPLNGVDLPSQKNFEIKEISYFKPNEIPALYAAARATFTNGKRAYRAGEAIILTLNTGMRLGELLGLQWENVNLSKRTITIRNTIVRVKERRDGQKTRYRYVEQHSTKTDAGYRVIALNAEAYKSMLYLKSIATSKYVVATEDGNHLIPRNLTRLLNQIVARAGINKQYGFHSLRHTFATLLFAAGEDLKTISALLGHSSVDVTADIYVHIMEEVQVAALNRVFNFTAPLPKDIQDISSGTTLYIPNKEKNAVKTYTLLAVSGNMAIVSRNTSGNNLQETLNTCALETKVQNKSSILVFPTDQCFVDLDGAKAMLD